MDALEAHATMSTHALESQGESAGTGEALRGIEADAEFSR